MEPDHPGAASLAVLSGIALASLSVLDFSILPCSSLYSLFVVTFGAVLGFACEIRGTPLFISPFLSSVRKANAVMVSTFFYRVALELSNFQHHFPLPYTFFTSMLSSFIFIYTYLGHDVWRIRILLPFIHVITVIITLFAPSDIHSIISRLYFAAAVLMLCIGPILGGRVDKKWKSAVIHVIFSICAVFTHRCFENLHQVSTLTCETFMSSKLLNVHSLFSLFPAISSIFTTGPIFLGTLIGFIIGTTISRKNRNELRYDLTFPFWSFIHRMLLSRPGPFPPPPPSSSSSSCSSISLLAYGQKHQSSSPLSVPAASNVPIAQRFRHDITVRTFQILDWADINMPVCDALEHPRFKPRVDMRLGLSFYFRPELIGVEVPTLPDTYKEAYESGELLSFLFMRSHGWRRARLPTREEKEQLREFEVNRVLDYDGLSHYEAKPGFCPYGGRVYLTCTDEHGTLCDESDMEIHDAKIIGIVTARDDTNTLIRPLKISDKPGWDHFLYAQRSIHSSMIFVEVVLHHLLEIHTVTSMISLSLHNAFDAVHGMDPHPFRSIMQCHFYSSTQVQEITTPHLLNRYATFAQVFALKPHAVASAIDDHYFSHNVLLEDCNMSKRKHVGNTHQFRDEQKYYKIFYQYASNIVRICWGDNDNTTNVESIEDEDKVIDMALESDIRMNKFLEELSSRLPTGKLPSRFISSQTGKWNAKGLRQFITEVLMLVTVRHETLGTKMALTSIDPKYCGLGAHVEDGMSPPKEDLFALICITIATSMKPFPMLLAQDTRDAISHVHKTYLGEKDKHAVKIINTFDEMVASLTKLQQEWEKDGEKNNRDCMRVMPDELNLMAGY